MTPAELGDFIKAVGLPIAILVAVLFFLYRAVWPLILEQITRAQTKSDEAEAKRAAAQEEKVDIVRAALTAQQAQTAAFLKSLDDRDERAMEITNAIHDVVTAVNELRAEIRALTEVRGRRGS